MGAISLRLACMQQTPSKEGRGCARAQTSPTSWLPKRKMSELQDQTAKVNAGQRWLNQTETKFEFKLNTRPHAFIVELKLTLGYSMYLWSHGVHNMLENKTCVDAQLTVSTSVSPSGGFSNERNHESSAQSTPNRGTASITNMKCPCSWESDSAAAYPIWAPHAPESSLI